MTTRSNGTSDKKRQTVIPGEFPDYLAVIGAELSSRYLFVKTINSGNTGVTFKLSDLPGKNFFCLKTISESVSGEAERERVRTTLKKEIEILDPLTHRCLPQVFDRNLDAPLPFYVCTYHPGYTFELFKSEGKRLTRDNAIFVVKSLIETFDYLHERGRTHCDLHHKNILISEEIVGKGILVIDFGSGHRDSDSEPITPDRGDPGLKDARGLMRHKQKVDRHDAASEFRANDIRAFGKALAFMTEPFFSAAPRDQYLAYVSFCTDLINGHYTDWINVKNRFELVIDPRALISGADRLFIRKSGEREAITVPVSRKVPVGEPILAVINTKIFQRLRCTKQLSFCDWFFPGGTHTRFEHSIGVFGTTHRALESLVHDEAFNDQYLQGTIDATLLAALVHDIGHYPFAHAMEHYISSRFSNDHDLKQSIHHFDHTLELLHNNRELIKAIENGWGPRVINDAEDILTQGIGVLSDLIDGPIDCDKLDYLRRDSHHCGVQFGEGLDVRGILSSYCCVDQGKELGIRRAGIPAVEGFMIVQNQMLGAVYWHETIRSVMCMFHRFLDGLLGVKPDKKRLTRFTDELKTCISEQEAIQKVVIPYLEKQPKKGSPRTEGSQEEMFPLIRLLVQPSFADIYRPIITYTGRDTGIAGRQHMPGLYQQILQSATTGASAIPVNWGAVKTLIGCFKNAFQEKCKSKVNRFEIIVDVPWGKATNRMVKVRGKDGRGDYNITEESHLENTIFSQPTAYIAPIRVFVSPRLFNEHAEQLGSIIRSAEERFLSKTAPSEDI